MTYPLTIAVWHSKALIKLLIYILNPKASTTQCYDKRHTGSLDFIFTLRHPWPIYQIKPIWSCLCQIPIPFLSRGVMYGYSIQIS